MTEEECLQKQLTLVDSLLSKISHSNRKFAPVSILNKLRNKLEALSMDKSNESNFSAWDEVINFDAVDDYQFIDDDFYWMDYRDVLSEIYHRMRYSEFPDLMMENILDSISPEFLKAYHQTQDDKHDNLVFKYNEEGQITVLSMRECIDALNKVKKSIEDNLLSHTKTLNEK